jgi:aminoglycoside 6-adenylyltransferase
MDEYDSKYTYLTKKMIDFAKESNDIRAVFIVGSKARDSKYNDRWSDIDYIVFTRKKDKFLKNENWIYKFGNPLTKIKQSTAGKDIEWSVSFDNGVDADFVFTSSKITAPFIRAVLFLAHTIRKNVFKKILFQLNMGASLYRSGYVCIYDLDNIKKAINELLKIEPQKEVITSENMESRNTCFWHYVERVVRKYKRGEYYIVRSKINDLIHNYVYKLIEIAELNKNDGKKIWYDGKLFETWCDPETNELLSRIYAMETKDDIKQSIIIMIELYQELFERIYKYYCFEFDYKNTEKLKTMIMDILQENFLTTAST